MSNGLVLDNISISVSGTPLLTISASVCQGNVLTIMGPSGSGKSTLIAAVAGNLDPAFKCAGHVFLNGKDITHTPAYSRKIGVLFQDDLLFPHLSVGQNLLFAIPSQLPRKERVAAAKTALQDVGLEGYFDRDPMTLSGGQRARVALMRMMLSKPEALMLDEPFAKLDMARRDQIRSLVFEHARKQGLPVLLVTHDDADAKAARGDVIQLGDTPN